MTKQDLIRQLLTSYNIDPNRGCWNWKFYTSGKRNDLRGKVRFNGRKYSVSRLSAYAFLGLDLNSKLMALHRCNNTICYNPNHLYVGTQSDNMKDRVAKGGVTHCIHGHEFTPENTCFNIKSNKRSCRICRRNSARKNKRNEKLV